MACLFILGESGVSRKRIAKDQSYVLGRTAQPMVFGDDLYISRNHLEVSLTQNDTGTATAVQKEPGRSVSVNVSVKGSRPVLFHKGITDYLTKLFHTRSTRCISDSDLSASILKVLKYMSSAGQEQEGLKENDSFAEDVYAKDRRIPGADDEGAHLSQIRAHADQTKPRMPSAFGRSEVYKKSNWRILLKQDGTANSPASKQLSKSDYRTTPASMDMTVDSTTNGLTLAFYAGLHNEKLTYPFLVVVPSEDDKQRRVFWNQVNIKSPSRPLSHDPVESVQQKQAGIANQTELKEGSSSKDDKVEAQDLDMRRSREVESTCPTDRESVKRPPIKVSTTSQRVDSQNSPVQIIIEEDLFKDIDLSVLDSLIPSCESQKLSNVTTQGADCKPKTPERASVQNYVQLENSPRVIEPLTPRKNRQVPEALLSGHSSSPAKNRANLARATIPSSPTSSKATHVQPPSTPIKSPKIGHLYALNKNTGSPSKSHSPKAANFVPKIFLGYTIICTPKGLPPRQYSVLQNAVTERGGKFIIAHTSLTPEELLSIYTTPVQMNSNVENQIFIKTSANQGTIPLPTVVVIGSPAHFQEQSAVLSSMDVETLPQQTLYHSWEWVSGSIVAGKILPKTTYPLFSKGQENAYSIDSMANTMNISSWFNHASSDKDGKQKQTEIVVIGEKRNREVSESADNTRFSKPRLPQMPTSLGSESDETEKSAVKSSTANSVSHYDPNAAAATSDEFDSMGRVIVGKTPVASEEQTSIDPTNIIDANKAIWSQLQGLSGIYKALGDNWRALAYSKAVQAVKHHPNIINLDEVNNIEGLGDNVREKVREILNNGGKLQKLKALESNEEIKVRQLFECVYGIGAKTAAILYNEGYKTLEELRKWPKLTNSQSKFLDHYNDLTSQVPRYEAIIFECVIKSVMERICVSEPVLASQNPTVHLLGSFRRGIPTLGDIDILIIIDDLITPSQNRVSNAPEVIFLEDALAAVLLARLLSQLHRIGVLVESLGCSLGEIGELSKLISTIPTEVTVKPSNPVERPKSLRDCPPSILKDLRVLRGLGWAPQESTLESKDTSEKISFGGKLSEAFAGIGILNENSFQSTGHRPHLGSQTKFLHRRVDIRVYTKSESAFAMLFFTGSAEFNRALRQYASDRGYRLSDHGLVYLGEELSIHASNVTSSTLRPGSSIYCSTEEQIFSALGLHFVPPNQRDYIPPEISACLKKPRN